MRNLTTLSDLSIAKLKAGVARVAAKMQLNRMLELCQGRNQLEFDDIWPAERARMMSYVDRAWQQDVLLEALLIEGETGLRTLFMCTDFESCKLECVMQQYWCCSCWKSIRLHSWMLTG